MKYDLYAPLGKCTQSQLIARLSDMNSETSETNDVFENIENEQTPYRTPTKVARAANRKRKARTPLERFKKFEHHHASMAEGGVGSPTVSDIYNCRVKKLMRVEDMSKKFDIAPSQMRIKIWTMPKKYWADLDKAESMVRSTGMKNRD